MIDRHDLFIMHSFYTLHEKDTKNAQISAEYTERGTFSENKLADTKFKNVYYHLQKQTFSLLLFTCSLQKVKRVYHIMQKSHL